MIALHFLLRQHWLLLKVLQHGPNLELLGNFHHLSAHMGFVAVIHPDSFVDFGTIKLFVCLTSTLLFIYFLTYPPL